MTATAAFLTKLAVERVDDSEYWDLLKPLAFRSVVAVTTFVVPVGFRTNFVTGREVPGVAWLAGTASEEAAALHDRLYETKEVTRAVADRVFVEALEAVRRRIRAAEKIDGVAAWRRGLANIIDVSKHWVMYAGLRLGGGSHWKEPASSIPDPVQGGKDASIS
jgi:hypothetical protein